MFRRACVLFALLLSFAPLAAAAGQLEVHFIDVGQGDAILIRSPAGKAVLLDAGNIGAGPVVDAYLTRLGIGDVDLAIASHPHLDHLGGMLEVLKHHAPKAWMDPGYAHPLPQYDALLTWLADAKVPVKNARSGRTIELEPGVTLRLMAPSEPFFSGTRSDANANTIVARLVYGDVSFLLTGDAEDETEKRLLASGETLKSTVLKVAHHGSKYSSSPALLGRVAASYAVVSCGQVNDYHHPHPSTLERLTSFRARLLRTDRDGDVIARTDGHALTWETTGERSGHLDEPGGPRSLERPEQNAHDGRRSRVASLSALGESGAASQAIDLNRATAAELEALPGIGPALAAAIVAHRPYKGVEDLRGVKGIGKKLLERLRPRLTAGKSSP
ncbi:MAG: hypothetical protein RL199_2413 [Pseudomonadota bacterium]|jgi:competence ComEA-like helix-hairpin-helix protein